jgi:hypothetical protein
VVVSEWAEIRTERSYRIKRCVRTVGALTILSHLRTVLRSAHTSNIREQTSTEREEPAETQTPTPDPRPNQPKIWEVQDNFGNTLTFEHDGSEQVHVEEEIVANDETEIQVCVTDIAKKLDDEIEYHFRSAIR